MAFTVKIQQKRNNTVPPLVTGRQDRAEGRTVRAGSQLYRFEKKQLSAALQETETPPLNLPDL